VPFGNCPVTLSRVTANCPCSGPQKRLVYTVEETAGILRMGKSTLYRLISHKRVPHHVLPTGVKCFTQGDIDQILSDGYRPARS
jgi:predicted DNA-binding transcriptional regulator AlpA